MNAGTLGIGHVLGSAPHDVGPKRLAWFLPAVSGLMLVGLLIGFAKTFFLRHLFSVSPMLPYLHVHGAVLTTWFALVFAQTSLVAAHRIELHRRLGILAVLVAAMVVPISAFVVVHAAQRMGSTHTALQRIEVVGDLLSLVCFAGFVAAGVHFRRRPDVHKRLMITSCFLIYGPVFVRFNLVYGLPIPPPAVVPLAVLTLAAYDFIVVRRLHRATVWITVLLGGVLLPLLGLLIASGAADAVIDALRA